MILRIFTILLFSVFSAFSYYPKVSVWRLPQDMGGATVVMLYDLHNYSRSLNEAQANYFHKNLPLMKDVALIMENQACASDKFRKAGLWCAPAELKSACLQAGIPVHEVDFRRLRVVTWQDCLSALTFTKPEQFDQLNEKLRQNNGMTAMLAREFYKAWEEIQEKIALLKSNNSVPSALIDKLEAVCDEVYFSRYGELEQWNHFQGTLLEYCQHNNCLTEDYLNKALLFDAQMLDVRIFLTIIEFPNKNTLVSAGANHCTRLEEYLALLNSTNLWTTGDIFTEDKPAQMPTGLSASAYLRSFMISKQVFRADGKELTPVQLDHLLRFFVHF